jgi:SnoaL-like polyketide cyclase
MRRRDLITIFGAAGILISQSPVFGQTFRTYRCFDGSQFVLAFYRPYRVFFASGDWTCSIARFTGTMKGPMMGPDGKEIPPTLKSFEVDFCTVARWEKGEIVEENLFYDVVGLMRQIGVGG